MMERSDTAPYESQFKAELSEHLSLLNRTNGRKKDTAMGTLSGFVAKALYEKPGEPIEKYFTDVCDRLHYISDFQRMLVYKEICKAVRAAIAGYRASRESSG